uniref:Uncharacterized protein n=1 Tax=Mola mola TaxID=94237 RepID=A0A3Q4BQD8_MOLML
ALAGLVSYSLQALGRSETRRDGGYKHNWSFSLSGDSEEESRHDRLFLALTAREPASLAQTCALCD